MIIVIIFIIDIIIYLWYDINIEQKQGVKTMKETQETLKQIQKAILNADARTKALDLSADERQKITSKKLDALRAVQELEATIKRAFEK